MTDITVPPFTTGGYDVAPVRPLVYSDGISILEYLKLLQQWINTTLIAHLNVELAEFGAKVDALIVDVEAKLTTQTEFVEGEIANMVEYVNLSVQAIVNNSIEMQDPVMAGLVESESLSRAALNGRYPHYVRWNGSEYAPRDPGALNIFFGPVDPGLAMGEGDFYANPNTTTLASVGAAIIDPSSSLYSAVSLVAYGDAIDLKLEPVTQTLVREAVPGYAGLYGWKFNEAATNILSSNFAKPFGWASARIRLKIIRTDDTAGGDLRMGASGAAFRDGAFPVLTASFSNTIVAAPKNRAQIVDLTTPINMSGMDSVGIDFRRSGTLAADTLVAPIWVIGAQIVRAS